MHRIWMGVLALSAGCSWVLPEPLPFTAENVEDAMVEDAAPPRPDFMIAPPVDLGQRFDMRPRRMDRGVVDEGVSIDMALAVDMGPEIDMAGPLDEGLIEVDQSVVSIDMAVEPFDEGVDATPDMSADLAEPLDPEPNPP